MTDLSENIAVPVGNGIFSGCGTLTRNTITERRENVNRRTIHKVCAWILASLFFIFPVTADAAPEGKMLLHQLDLGCAAGYLIESGDTVILVDCGVDSQRKDAKSPWLFEYLEKSGIGKLDLYIVTHWHTDHAAYVDEILTLYGDEQTVVYGTSPEIPDKYLPLPAGTYRQMTDGTELDEGPFHIVCVGPEDPDNTGNLNLDSLNFVVTFGEKKFMFTGDFVQDNIVKRHPDEISDVDLLCFPHHALQPYVISNIALRMMDPDILFIPANKQGAIRLYCNDSDVTCRILCSGKYGNMVAVCDGTEIEIVTEVLPGQFAGE